MNYNELKDITKIKNILVKDLAMEMGVTRQGLQKMIDNETIELRLIKKMCELLNISPAKFFELGQYGLNISNSHVQAGNGNKIIIENKDREIEMLKQRINDKDEIIQMLREKIESIHHAPMLAASEKSIYKTK